jgi:hypothetical protein
MMKYLLLLLLFVALSYICEARPMEVASGQNHGQVCEFPFTIDGHEFYDCTQYNNAIIGKFLINLKNTTK